MNNLNILYLAHRIPYPPNKGDKLRAFRQIEHLARRHRVWCGCFVDRPGDEQYAEALGSYCEEVAAIPLPRSRAVLRGLVGLSRGRTLTEAFYRSREMDERIARWTAEIPFDVAYAFSSSMAPYALSVPAPRRVLDLCDLDSRKWEAYAAGSRGPLGRAYLAEAQRLQAAEQRWIEAFDATILITEEEASTLVRQRCNHAPEPQASACAVSGRRWRPQDREAAQAEACGSAAIRRPNAVTPGDLPGGRKIHIVGNGVHLPALRPLRTAEKIPTVGFIGVMDYRPNVDAVEWFAESCWDGVRRAVPEAVFRIVGRSPTRRVRGLARIPGVQVIGEVDDVAPELERFSVSVAPLRIARGLQNKVLEAMAAARPVVLTRAAAEGVGGEDGRDYLLADDPASMTASVVGLLGDATHRRRLGAQARRFVDRRHQWSQALGKLDLIITGASDPREHDRLLLGEQVTDTPQVLVDSSSPR